MEPNKKKSSATFTEEEVRQAIREIERAARHKKRAAQVGGKMDEAHRWGAVGVKLWAARKALEGEKGNGS